MCICGPPPPHTHTHALTHIPCSSRFQSERKERKKKGEKGCRSKCTVEPRYKEIWQSYNEQHVLFPINYPCLALLIVTNKQNKSILNKLQSCE